MIVIRGNKEAFAPAIKLFFTIEPDDAKSSVVLTAKTSGHIFRLAFNSGESPDIIFIIDQYRFIFLQPAGRSVSRNLTGIVMIFIIKRAPYIIRKVPAFLGRSVENMPVLVFVIGHETAFRREGSPVLQTGYNERAAAVFEVYKIEVIHLSVPCDHFSERSVQESKGKILILVCKDSGHIPVSKLYILACVRMINSKVSLLLYPGPHIFLVRIDQRVIPVPYIHSSFFKNGAHVIEVFLLWFFSFFLLVFADTASFSDFFWKEAEIKTAAVLAPG